MSNKFILNESDEINKILELQETNDFINKQQPEYDAVGYKTGEGIVRNGKRFTSIAILGSKEAVYTGKTTCAPFPDSITGASTYEVFLPSSAINLQLSSTSANDTYPAGSHARVISIIGFDASFNLIVDTLLMTGQTPVVSNLKFFRVRALVVQQSGSNTSINDLVNEGTIFLTPSGDATTLGVPDDLTRIVDVMSIGTGIASPGVFSIAPGQEIYPSEMVISVATEQKDIFFTVEILGRDSAGLSGWRLLTKLNVNTSQPVVSLHQGGFPNVDYTGGQLGTDIQLVVYRSAGSGVDDDDFSITVFVTAMLVTPV